MRSHKYSTGDCSKPRKENGESEYTSQPSVEVWKDVRRRKSFLQMLTIWEKITEQLQLCSSGYRSLLTLSSFFGYYIFFDVVLPRLRLPFEELSGDTMTHSIPESKKTEHSFRDTRWQCNLTLSLSAALWQCKAVILNTCDIQVWTSHALHILQMCLLSFYLSSLFPLKSVIFFSLQGREIVELLNLS